MKKFAAVCLCGVLCACAYDPYKLKVDNRMAEAHGKSIYFRSSLRSSYAGQIRRMLSNKFGEMGIKTATAAENADYIAIFDIETFYRQTTPYKNTSFMNTMSDSVLFSDSEDAHSLYFSGNANMQVDRDQTCFTLNMGPKGTSNVLYASSFCARDVMETEQFVPYVLDIYGKYATYQNADVGIQCLDNPDGSVSCNPMHDRQQAFINSLWIEQKISED